MPAPTLSAQFQEAYARIDEAIAQCARQLDDLPDNPAVKRCRGQPNAFAISAGAVLASDRWDPFYHDWAAQYRYVRELLERGNVSALAVLLSGHAYRDAAHGKRTLAPPVIAALQRLTGDLTALEVARQTRHTATP